ncbi:unnamed protein product [Mycena citricolor]|uniref:Uncharacterized protein n=1 Tax=Mycena citricolor TaxID=2018698 RepID=A0AAD2H395_9AGAR|nr:unnamed protein product [Mycena citricolor]
MAPPTPQRVLRLSTNSSPSPQKAFSFSTAGSVLRSSTGYPPSPLSTPTKSMHYSMAPGASTNTLLSSTTSVNTPSPIVSAYLGKHTGNFTARPLDGAFLSEIQRAESDDE